ncbi:MAG: hypothetical protein P8I56_09115, partial [Paracoccaceae bacterium]|nr:hypothetical protein [Paracoccaceae bacterium]
SGSKEFRRLVSNIVDQDEAYAHMPDYAVSLVSDMVVFRNRGTLLCPVSDSVSIPPLQPDTYHEARMAAPITAWMVCSEIVDCLPVGFANQMAGLVKIAAPSKLPRCACEQMLHQRKPKTR